MKVIVILLIGLITLPVLAGTWIDDFEDGNLDEWVRGGNGKWEVVDGQCKVTLFAGGSCALLMTGELDWQDYSVEAEFRAETPRDYLGFRVRVQDWDNGYPWVIHAGNRQAHWYTQFNGQFTRLTTDAVFGNLVDKMHTLKAVVEGDKFQGYYDGKLIRTIHDKRFKTGKILMGICGSGPSAVFFDNVVITGEGIPDRNPFAVASGGKLATLWAKLKAF